MENKNFTILETTIEDVHQAILDKKVSAVELVEFYQQRIRELDKKGPELQAIITMNEKAKEVAAELDEYVTSTGKLKGRLHGIPILVKDQAETKDMVTTFGSKAFTSYLPEKDAHIIEKMKQEGAIILAKSNLCDFAAGWFSFSSVQDRTKNPYATERDAGGSSAGTSAGITANFATVGIGEDTGGSIRLPASFNNLFGLRVTTGLVSRTGFSPLVHFQDTPGPIGRTAKDVAKLLDVIAGYDPADAFTAICSQTDDIGKYEASLQEATLKGTRIGILRQAFGEGEDAASVNKQMERVISQLKEAGSEIIDPVEIPNLAGYLETTSLYVDQSKTDITNFLSKRPTAPLKSFQEVYDTKSFHPLNDLFHNIAEGSDNPEDNPTYYKQRLAQEEFRREILQVFASHNLDAILFPDVQVLPPTYEDLEAQKWTCLTFPTNTVIASQSILPAISIPSGLNENNIPVGFELLGKPLTEKALLGYAAAYEKLVQPRKAPNLNPTHMEKV